jgi:hypothetical protein
MRVMLTVVAFAASVSAVSAQTSQRFTFQQVEGGLMRLDTETGHVSLCTRGGADYICRSVADDRMALQAEIDRLKQENDTLKKIAGATPAPGAGSRLQLPSEEELDKAMGLFEKMMRRMMKTMREEPMPDRL